MSKQIQVTVILREEELRKIIKYTDAADYVEAIVLAVAQYSDDVSKDKENSDLILPKPEHEL